MKTNNLLPNKHKLTGWIIFSIGLISILILSLFPEFEGFIKVPVVSIYHDGFMSSENDGFFKLVENDITGELAALFLIIGGFIKGPIGNLVTRASALTITVVMINAFALAHRDWFITTKLFTSEQIFLFIIALYFLIRGNK